MVADFTKEQTIKNQCTEGSGEEIRQRTGQ